MPLLDMSDAFDDANLCDDFVILRSLRTTGDDGLTVDTPTQIAAWGSVQPAQPAALDIMPNAERDNAFLTVITQTRLVPATDTTAPDRIVWEGRTWQVSKVSDWSSWGTGFVNALCELVDMTVQAP